MTRFIPLVKANIEEQMNLGEGLKPDVCIDPALLDLVRLRMAQMSKCRGEIKKQRLYLQVRGESGERLGKLKAWRKSSCFSAREKAALALGEAVASGSPRPVLDPLLDEARPHFAKEELIALLLAIMPPTDWNSARFKVLRQVTSKLIYLK
jgi:alkylhydroperoxidase family enzyme